VRPPMDRSATPGAMAPAASASVLRESREPAFGRRSRTGWGIPLGIVATWLLGWNVALTLAADEVPDPLAGYATFTQMEGRLKQLAESPRAELTSLGQTLGQRDLWLLKIADDPEATRPAILIVGNVHAPHVLGRELALRMAETLVAAQDPGIEALLAEYTVFVIPSPTPDATEKNFGFPVRQQAGNLTPTDDDRDFEVGEDPPVDLNQDGWITMMRVAEEFGSHRTHPSDPRILIPVDPKKHEVGQYRLLTEARDADGDEKFGEDASDGVDFNRNFTFNYPYFGKGAGPHQVSEIESRQVADFMFDHPNIAFVLCFSPEDNLFHPWKGSSQTDSPRIKTKILTADQPFTDRLAETFRKAHGGKGAPSPPSGAGSFSEWSYFHFGRWTFASRAWWAPPAEKAKAEQPKSPDQTDDDKQTDQSDTSDTSDKSDKSDPSDPSDKSAALAKDDKRGQDELTALAWYESQGIEVFVDWQPFEHPDLPDQHVEIGGFKPLYLLNPPEKLIQPLVAPHVDLLTEVTGQWPRLDIRQIKAVRLGPGLYDIRCQLVNTGALPTMPQMASVNRQWYPIQIQLLGADGARWIQGSQRQAVGRLRELGGQSELRWVFQLENVPETGEAFKIQAYSPTLHSVEVEVEVIDP